MRLPALEIFLSIAQDLVRLTGLIIGMTAIAWDHRRVIQEID
jgi:hypothetical protein